MGRDEVGGLCDRRDRTACKVLRLRFLLGDGFVFRAVAAERGKRAAATTRVGGRRSKQDGVAAASRENNQIGRAHV